MNTSDHFANWPAEPYKGLAYYELQDTLLFAGREEDVHNCADELNSRSTKILVLHGTTGCGKSSFLRAGLIPFLEQEVVGFQFLTEKEETENARSLFIRSTDKPLLRLCEKLILFLSHEFLLTTPRGSRSIEFSPERKGLEDVYKNLSRLKGEEELNLKELDVQIRLINEHLESFSTRLPYKMALVIDQAEEALTLSKGKEGSDSREGFFRFLSLFSKTSYNLKILIAIRTEWYGRFMNEMKLRRANMTNKQDFFLSELTKKQIIDAILRPTLPEFSQSPDEDHVQKSRPYKFSYEEGLPEQIATDLLKRNLVGGVLPVLQIVCSTLYQETIAERGSDELWEITTLDYKELGAIEGQIYVYLDNALSAFAKEKLSGCSTEEMKDEVGKWKDLLAQIAKTEIDGTVRTDLVSEEDLVKKKNELDCKIDFEEMMRHLSSEDQRILRRPEKIVDVHTGKVFNAYSLGHDAIGLVLTTWGKTRDQEKKDERVTDIKLIKRQLETYFIIGFGYFIFSLPFFYFWGTDSVTVNVLWGISAVGFVSAGYLLLRGFLKDPKFWKNTLYPIIKKVMDEH